MIQEVIMYEYHCDGCGHIYDDWDGNTMYSNKEWIFTWLENDADWRWIDGKWYCADCYELNEDTDEYIVKPTEK